MSYAYPEILWSVERLRDSLTDPKLVLLDMRPPEVFSNGHIPGARNLDIFGISLVDTRQPALDAFLWIIEHLIQAKGVDDDSRVIIYDDDTGMRSARLFWFLEFFGHADVHVLHGGYTAWTAAGLPTTQNAAVPASGKFKMKQRRERLATADDVLARIGRPDAVIVDTRSEAEYTGQLVRSARGGAIPGATHLEWTRNLTPEGFFKSAADLQSLYAKAGIPPGKEIVPYCQGGYRAAHTYLALRLIGYPKLRNYLGSWGEWGNRPELPIQ